MDGARCRLVAAVSQPCLPPIESNIYADSSSFAQPLRLIIIQFKKSTKITKASKINNKQQIMMTTKTKI
ncbi:hypothetical protein KT99_14149 [Shewanella benthica KT99]|uniref:Uncharacterized protein n=1 Tax=Shewanella benthica KT99 TaxID=314608 RepID=A9EI60_9GAMM|nr:hypothetical protein KT99_14149 [Shewanella benthica KT99]